MIDALPLYVPAIPFALVLGLAIVDSGLNPLVGWSSSPLVFGGAAQLTLITLLGSGASTLAAIVAAMVVQARHLMYSAALAPVFQRQPRWFRWFGPYLLIDQMFALSILRAEDEPDAFRSYYLGAASLFWSFWMITTAVGLFIGPVIPAEWSLGFAVPILFLGLLVMGIDRWPKVVAALVAAAVTFVFAGLPNRVGLLVGALAGLLIGVVVERWRR
ncbi:MAG: AzlC family ABC transporter permease [Actinobacteria bacterium]|nr:AzlC family ABC transporter permease [Actinomycetota bacterium]